MAPVALFPHALLRHPYIPGQALGIFQISAVGFIPALFPLLLNAYVFSPAPWSLGNNLKSSHTHPKPRSGAVQETYGWISG